MHQLQLVHKNNAKIAKCQIRNCLYHLSKQYFFDCQNKILFDFVKIQNEQAATRLFCSLFQLSKLQYVHNFKRCILSFRIDFYRMVYIFTSYTQNKRDTQNVTLFSSNTHMWFLVKKSSLKSGHINWPLWTWWTY